MTFHRKQMKEDFMSSCRLNPIVNINYCMLVLFPNPTHTLSFFILLSYEQI